jgi:hypothetical protein
MGLCHWISRKSAKAIATTKAQRVYTEGFPFYWAEIVVGFAGLCPLEIAPQICKGHRRLNQSAGLHGEDFPFYWAGVQNARPVFGALGSRRKSAGHRRLRSWDSTEKDFHSIGR